MKGKISEKINNNFGYIMGENEKLYLFSTNDILDDTKITIGEKVSFKPLFDKILKATYIYRLEEGDNTENR